MQLVNELIQWQVCGGLLVRFHYFVLFHFIPSHIIHLIGSEWK